MSRCGYCLRRSKFAGGNASCPLLTSSQVHSIIDGSIDHAATWDRHTTTFPDGCASFRIGDYTPRPPTVKGGDQLALV